MQPKDLSVTVILPSAAGAADVRTAAASTPVTKAREAVMKDIRRRMVIPVESHRSIELGYENTQFVFLSHAQRVRHAARIVRVGHGLYHRSILPAKARPSPRLAQV